MSTIRRIAPVPGPAAPAMPAAPDPASPEADAGRTGRTAPIDGGGFGDSTEALASSVETAAMRLAPTLGTVAPAPLLRALGDGTAAIDVPLRPGDYTFSGVSFTVKPGTVAHVQVQVRNGELVSVGHGVRGTSVKVDPPLDLPLWVTGRGVELQGNPSSQRFEAELGGFFDLSLKAKKLSELVASGDARGADTSLFKMPDLMPLVTQLVDLSKVKVDATVTLREAELDVGGAKVKVDPSTTFSVKGDGQHATLSGHVQLDGFGLDQAGVKLSSTRGGQADLSASLDGLEGGYALDSRLEHVQLSVDRLESARPSALTPGAIDRLAIGPSEVRDGTIRLTSKVDLTGLRPTNFSSPTVAMRLQASGTINDASLTVKDTKDTASLAVAGTFKGTLDLGPEGVKLEAALTGAHFELRDLQQNVKGNAVSIEHASADGEVTLSASPSRLQIDGQVRGLDLVVDDFKGGAGAVTADMGRTHVSGSARFHVGAAGVQADGRLRAEATIDSATFSATGRSGSLGSSTMSGELTKLDLGKDAPVMKLEHADASLNLKRAALEVGRATIRGGGQLKGSGTVVLDATGLSLDGASQVSIALTDGRVRSSTVDLKLSSGSVAQLELKDLHLGRKTKITVGAGTRIDSVLAGGTMTVAGQTVELAKGGRAEFIVKQADLSRTHNDLRGSVKLEAQLKGSVPALTALGVAVHPTGIEGLVRVSLDDVHLADERLTLDGGTASLDARVGHYIGVQNPGQPGLGSLKAPLAVRTVAEVQQATAAQLAGLTPLPMGAPMDALKLVRDGQLKLDLPLTGSIRALGLDLMKMPAGARVGVSVEVKDGKLGEATLMAGINGRSLSVSVPHFMLPADMHSLAALTTGNGPVGATSSAALGFIDLEHAQLDITNATFAKGRVSLPGGVAELAEGSKLSFHGTLMAGELTGAVALNSVTVARDELALKGTGGRADLHLTWRRDGDKAIVDAGLTNLALTTQAVTHKGVNGDYVSLGAGRISGGAVSFSSSVLLDARGVPRTDVLPTVKGAALTVAAFSGELLGARQRSAQGLAEVGRSRVEGSLSFSAGAGLTLKAKVDEVDAQVSGVKLQRAGRTIDVERARLMGRSGSIDFSPSRVLVDAKQLAWDVIVREASLRTGHLSAKGNQVHITGEGHFDYDSRRDLRLEGALHVDGGVSGAATLPARSVTVDPVGGLVVR